MKKRKKRGVVGGTVRGRLPHHCCSACPGHYLGERYRLKQQQHRSKPASSHFSITMSSQTPSKRAADDGVDAGDDHNNNKKQRLNNPTSHVCHNVHQGHIQRAG